MKKYNPSIEAVLPGSPAADCGICAEEKLVAVNGIELRDIIDYQYLTEDCELTLTVEGTDGSLREIELSKDEDEDLGICFKSAVFDGIHKCCNHCIFCFVDQMIPGQRETLYVKDDDYRLSFLYGNYITLTNLKSEDFDRIKKQRLSPLYISVHCLDEQMRSTILGRKDKRPFKEMLQELSDCGIEMHGQIVLVPGYNDGKFLQETVEGIAAIPGFQSLALVPVGLTKCKNPALTPYDREKAGEIIEFVQQYQKRFLAEKGTRFVYASDEFYLFAESEIPSEEEYEYYPQIENGVGIIRQFTEDFAFSLEDLAPINKPLNIQMITGVHGEAGLKEVFAMMADIPNLTVTPLTVINTFFGDTVTVTGLLTGKDILHTLQNHKQEGMIYLLPDVLLKHHSELFLDGMSVNELIEQSGCDIRITEASGTALVDMIGCLKEEFS